MEYIANFEKTEGIRMCVPFDKMNEDGSLLTTCNLMYKKGDRHTGASHYNVKLLQDYRTYQVFPKVPFNILKKVSNDSMDANYLRIDYYMGQSSYDIISTEENKIFIIEEKLPVKCRPRTRVLDIGEEGVDAEMEGKNGRVNTVLNYIGLEHIEKPLDKVAYEGDAYTKIQLLEECRYNLFKFQKRVEPSEKYTELK